MSDTLFSPSWYRVAGLKPRIRSHTQILRHEYRGCIWFVLQDHAAGRSHRFTPAAHHFIGLMDGDRTVHEIWEATCEHLGDEAPTQDEIIRLLAQLHAADALLCDVPPDSMEVFRRYQKHQRMQWKRRLWTPLALRFPIFDPDRFLARTLHVVRPLFGWFGAVLWLLVVVTGAVLAAVHWTDLSKDVMDRVLAPQNLLLLWLIYPVVKAFHELGHAYATKYWGGEVHEIGIMLLVLTPVPYVDASSSTGFRSKHKRMVVGAIGIMTELFLGALALFVWLNVESGAVSAITYNIMLISGVSTLFFNGNPLLRFDGYYVLADALEIPNLGTRSNKYLGYLFQRYILRVKDAESPANTTGERVWMVIYGIAAFLYRIFIMFVIILFIGGKFFLIGVMLAFWAIATQVFVPIGKSLSYLVNSPKLRNRRGRALATTAAVALVVLALLFMLPAPSWTRSEGVIWVPEDSQVRAGTAGFVREILVPEDSNVSRGQELIRMEDPFLLAQVAILRAQLQELKSQFNAIQSVDRVEAGIVREQIAAISAKLQRNLDRKDELVIRSPADGSLIIPNASDLEGRFVRQGQAIAYVVQPRDLKARVVVDQDSIAMVRQRNRGVEIMLADWGADPLPARILREVPSASNRLPTAALGSNGGGPYAVDPRDSEGLTTLTPVFQLELALPPQVDTAYLGSRIYVRFEHVPEPVGVQVYRALRQLLLRRFNV